MNPLGVCVAQRHPLARLVAFPFDGAYLPPPGRAWGLEGRGWEYLGADILRSAAILAGTLAPRPTITTSRKPIWLESAYSTVRSLKAGLGSQLSLLIQNRTTSRQLVHLKLQTICLDRVVASLASRDLVLDRIESLQITSSFERAKFNQLFNAFDLWMAEADRLIAQADAVELRKADLMVELASNSSEPSVIQCLRAELESLTVESATIIASATRAVAQRQQWSDRVIAKHQFMKTLLDKTDKAGNEDYELKERLLSDLLQLIVLSRGC